MIVKDLEGIAKLLDKLIKEAKGQTKWRDLVHLEKTALNKFQIHVDWWLSLAKRSLNGAIDPKQKAAYTITVSKWEFIKKQIGLFIEVELQDERDKIQF